MQSVCEHEYTTLAVHDYTTLVYIYPALMYAVMFYVILNKRKRLGDCVTFFTLEGDTMQRVDVDTP